MSLLGPHLPGLGNTQHTRRGLLPVTKASSEVSFSEVGPSVARAEQFPGALRQPRHDLQTLKYVMFCVCIDKRSSSLFLDNTGPVSGLYLSISPRGLISGDDN